MRRTTLQHTLVAGLAATAVAVSPAIARPIDRVDRYDNGTPAPKQDLRGEHARDAARAAEDPQFKPGQPTWPTHPAPAPKPAAKPAPAKHTGGGGDDDWLTLGIGIAAAGIVAGSGAGVARRYRIRARRATA